ncbi:histone-like nucleoid-structuring protein Lsr2 [Streptomyces sp. NPDC090119]|uniref:Lsr2 family DNA-binding protein n=1 Tax=Streptomyces sp. NPDC090119 TaxID=3365951 RepID=UPI00380DCBC1
MDHEAGEARGTEGDVAEVKEVRGAGNDAIERWARAHGYVVHHRGRIPADIRQPYEG